MIKRIWYQLHHHHHRYADNKSAQISKTMNVVPAHHGQLVWQWVNSDNTDDVTSYGGSDKKGVKSLGSSEGDGGGAKHIEGIEAEENQAESNVWEQYWWWFEMRWNILWCVALYDYENMFHLRIWMMMWMRRFSKNKIDCLRFWA